MEILKNQIYELAIDGMTSEGNGVGRLDGYTVFVPDTAEGDSCRVRLVKVQKNYGYGRLEELLSPSPFRIPSDCPVSVQCGGCAFRHISYEKELSVKTGIVRDAFARLGGITLPVAPIIASPRQYEYRNKAQYPVGAGRDGGLESGFYARRSHRIVPSKGCRLQPKVFDGLHSAVLQFLSEKGIPAYDSASGKGLIRHIYFRLAEATGEIMVCLVGTDSRDKRLEGFAEFLTASFPQIASIVFNENRDNTNVILGKKCVTLWGSDTITDVLCGVKVELSPLSFYQVNHDQAEALYQKAMEYASPGRGEILLDLYCGAGTIGLSAAHLVRELIGVEIVPEAVENARQNARNNGITNARFLCADAGQAASQLAGEGIRPDVIIVDPPRKGLDQRVIDAIVKMSPSRLVMVSCNPATAARDAALLREKGYEPQAIAPVDLFPRTPHVECVVLMTR